MLFNLNIISLKIFILLISKLFITFQTEILFYNTNPFYSFLIDKSFQSLDSSKKLLLDIMHGKLPFKLESPSKFTYDMEFIEKINGNFPFPYTLKSLELDPENNGILLGAGINLLNFKPDEMENILRMTFIPWPEKEKIKLLCQKSGKEAIDMIQNNKDFIFSLESIKIFNKVVIDYIIDNRIINEFGKAKKLLKTPLINGFLSAYIQLPKVNNDLNNILFNNYTSGSYIVQHLFEGAPFSRFIQSKLILMMDGNVKFNNNHLLFVLPMAFEENEKNNIRDLIISYSIYLTNYYNFNKIRISILIFDNENKKYLINYNPKEPKPFEDLFNFNSENKTKFINFSEIYEYIENLFEKNKNSKIYENKIISLFLNYNTNKLYFNEINNLISKYKKKGIQTIPLINKSDFVKNFDIIDYNIFFDFNKAINIGPLKMAVSNMHINIDLTNKNEKINLNEIVKTKIEKIKLNDIDAPLYIEVTIYPEKNESVYYEISLEINKTSGYNIFVSDSNPYPNIKDYTIKFIKYDDNLNPKIRIKAYLLNKFYIAIKGILYFDLIIEKKYNLENEEIIKSEGEYEKKPYNISIYLKDEIMKNLESFTSNYKLKSNLLNGDFTLDSVLKYFTRGIDLDNTDDRAFFNYNLFTYLFGDSYLINTIYRNSENNNYYIGRYFELNQNSPFRLREEGLNELIISKIYPFINGNNRTLIDNKIPAVSFNDNELKLIYNITNRKYILNLENLLNRTLNTINFKNLPSETKFVLLCLYFQNSKENLEIIKNLAHKEPKYPEVLKSLKEKDKNQDFFNKFMISFISNFDQQIKFEKILINVVIGQSFALSDIGVKFVEDFYNAMSKTKAKISLSIYDTLKTVNKIKTIIPFYSKKISKILEEYKNKNNNLRNKYNSTDEQKMDFEKIIKFGLSYFSKYDTGIKKELFIICDENINKKDKYYINNKLTNLDNNQKIQIIMKDQIKIILLSTKNVEKGYIPELFKLRNPFTINENYFHVNNFEDTNLYMNDLARIAKDSLIKLNLGTRLINDFYQGKISYYEINCGDFLSDIIIIKANLSNFNFYYSFDNPFPNPYLDIKADKTADDDKIIFSDLQNDKIYLGIESKNEVRKQIIEFFSCEIYYSKNQYKNCKFIESHRFLWYGFFLLTVSFIIGLAVYFLGHSSKNQINIFDQ